MVEIKIKKSGTRGIPDFHYIEKAPQTEDEMLDLLIANSQIKQPIFFRPRNPVNIKIMMVTEYIKLHAGKEFYERYRLFFKE